MITGTSYVKQTIINLDTGNILEGAQDDFCWAKVYAFPDSNTLLVDGCYWAGPYEYKFFDFTDPENGWPELFITDDNDFLSGEIDPLFINDKTVSLFEGEELFIPLNARDNEIEINNDDLFYKGILVDENQYNDDKNWTNIEDIKRTFERQGDKIVLIDKYISEFKTKQLENSAAIWKKFDEKTKDFNNNNPLFLELKNLMLCKDDSIIDKAKALFFPTIKFSDTSWCSWQNWKVNIILTKGKHHAKVSWELESDSKIKLSYHPKTTYNGTSATEILFDRSIDGIRLTIETLDKVVWYD